MEQFKRAKVFVLETKETPQIGDTCYANIIGWFIYTKNHLKGNVIANLVEYKSVKVYKMYITEYTEIEDKDYFIVEDSLYTNLFIKTKGDLPIISNKVIAILGNHIYPPCDRHCSDECVCTYPHPSSNFVMKWIEEANKDNIITDILVEYEYLLDDMVVLPYWQLKINSKDNTIAIKKAKETYTKEELCQILEKYTSFIWSEVGIHYPISLGNSAKEKFINLNL